MTSTLLGELISSVICYPFSFILLAYASFYISSDRLTISICVFKGVYFLFGENLAKRHIVALTDKGIWWCGGLDLRRTHTPVQYLYSTCTVDYNSYSHTCNTCTVWDFTVLQYYKSQLNCENGESYENWSTRLYQAFTYIFFRENWSTTDSQHFTVHRMLIQK